MTLQKTKITGDAVLSHINTNKFKTGTLTLSFCLPLSPRSYLLGLLLAGVMRRGTESYPSLAAINRRLDMLYAANIDVQSIIRGDVLCFTLGAELLEARFSLDGTDISDGVIETLSELLLRPLKKNGLFPEDTLESEKVFVRDSLLSEQNETGVYAQMRLKELMMRTSAFPTLEYLLGAIDSVSASEFTDFHSRLLKSPLSIFYVGGEDTDTLCKKLERHLGVFKANPAPLFAPPRPTDALPFCDVCEDKAVNQGKLGLGLRSGTTLGSHGASVAVMFNELFGASPASKLFLGVRERLGLCYYCYSSYSLLSGDISVHSGIDVANRERTEQAIMSCLEDMRRGDISETELTAARKALSYSYVQLYDSPYALSSFYLVRSLFGVRQTVDEALGSILKVDTEQLASLARRVSLDTRFFLNGTLKTEEGEE